MNTFQPNLAKVNFGQNFFNRIISIGKSALAHCNETIKFLSKNLFVFVRDRINTGTKDIFTECGKIDDQALKIAVADGAGDVLLDLQTFEDNTLEEGFGGAVSDKSGVNSGNIVHQSMIKRFNQHSTMVSLVE